MKKKYHVKINHSQIGFCIQEVEVLKEHNVNYMLVQPKTIWKWGQIQPLDKKAFYRKDSFFDTLDQAIEYCYNKIEGIVETLKTLRDGSLQNVKVMEEILKEEKKLALESSRTYKKYSSQLRNIDIEKMLERQGIVEQ